MLGAECGGVLHRGTHHNMFGSNIICETHHKMLILVRNRAFIWKGRRRVYFVNLAGSRQQFSLEWSGRL